MVPNPHGFQQALIRYSMKMLKLKFLMCYIAAFRDWGTGA